MASISKLSIRGVRAFSPDDVEQVVEFYFPLTIITGANGCGKTTIIEALKFALSGSMPPGGAARSAGQSFVHDPRALGQSVVKANIKLRFTNKAGASMVVIRSMEVTQKKTTMTFKQLDGVIRSIDVEKGERVTLSHKCGELDKQIPQLLGVSKAILDYVLFVHQEDSSWPLQEAAILKKRFDDIFDSTRYSKALESFRKTKKELASEVKNIKVTVAELASHKHAATGFRKEREMHHQNLQQLEQEIAECERIEKDAEEETTKYYAILEQVGDIQDQLNSKEMEIKNLRNVTGAQRSMLEKDLTKELSQRELEDKLKDFDKEMKKEKERLEDLQCELKEVEREIEELRRREMHLNSSKGKVAAERDAQDKRIKDRYAMLTTISQTYSLDLQQSMTQLSHLDDSFMSLTQGSTNTKGEISKEDLQEFLRTLKLKEEELKEGLRNHKAECRAREEEFNKSLQQLVGNKNSFDSQRNKLISEGKDIENEMRELASSFGSKRMKKSALDDFREQAKQAQRRLEDMMKNDDREKLGAEIRSFNEKLDQLKDDIEDKQSSKSRLKSSAGLQARIEMMKEVCVTESKSLQESIESKKEVLKSFQIDVPEQLPNDPTIAGLVPKIVDSVEAEYQRAKLRAETAAETVEKTKHQQAQQNASFVSLKQTLTGLESRRDSLKQPNQSVGKVKRVVAGMKEFGFNVENWKVEDEPQELLDTLIKYLADLEDNSPEDIPPEVLTKVMKRLKKMGKSQKECPCCRRYFSGDEQKIFSDTVKKLQDKSDSPLLRGDNEEMQNYRDTKAKVEGFRSTVYKCMNDLHEYRRILAEIAEKQPKVEQGESLLKALQKNLERNQVEATETKKVEKALLDLQETSRRWREHSCRIEEQFANIADKEDALECETAGSIGDGTLDQVELALQQMQDEQAALYEKISKKNKKISAINSDFSAAQARAASTADLCKRKEEKYAEEQKASERKQFIEDRKTTISNEISKLGEQIQSLQQKIRAKEAEKSRLYAYASDEEAKLNESFNNFISDLKHLQDLNKQIEEYARNDDANRLEQIESEVAKIVAEIKEKQAQSHAMKPQLDNLVKIVDDQERQEKLLHDNIDLHLSEARLCDLEEEVLELEKALSLVDGAATAQGLLDKAVKRISESNSKRSRLSGRRAEIVEQIRNLQRKLQSQEYKNVDEEHKEAVIKKETTEMAAVDLDRYASALDKALLRFHSIKIAEINKIVKELWLKCYQGNDITNIELESGQESRAAKSYNYRVVMTKGQTKMDMRGRCSAGQRVLASIVIRLALAETFGVHCGCLVLDEPTVNLDEANRGALATAMAQIIANRSQQANFQLVLITHDEEFISLMKDELSTQTGFSMPEKYFMVKREEDSPGKYYSKIYAVDWDDLV